MSVKMTKGPTYTYVGPNYFRKTEYDENQTHLKLISQDGEQYQDTKSLSHFRETVF